MIWFWFLIGVAGRLIIHIPDATPITALCLLSPRYFSKKNALLLIVAILISSDCALHFLLHYPVFGSWTLFTYSGWLFVLCAGLLLKKYFSFLNAVLLGVFSSVVFWVWTNLGTWMTTHLYSHTMMGLWDCFAAGLPFLRNSIVATTVSITLALGCAHCDVVETPLMASHLSRLFAKIRRRQ